MGSESQGSNAVQLARKTKGFELMSVGKDLIERVPVKDTTNVEVGKVPDRNEERGVAPRTMFDGQGLDFGLDAFEEVVEKGCISALCGEGEIPQIGEFWEDELSGSIGGPGPRLSIIGPRVIIRETIHTQLTIRPILGNKC